MTEYHGIEGRVPTTVFSFEELGGWQQAFYESALGVGYPNLRDLSSPSPREGVSIAQVNIKDSVRWNSAFAFLDSVRENRNLVIIDEAEVQELKVTNKLCKSIHYRRNGRNLRLSARLIVVCAGAIGTPLLLYRSGIGPQALLRKLGLTPTLVVPGVGENLMDHPGVAVTFKTNRTAVRSAKAENEIGKCYETQVTLRASSTHLTKGFNLHIIPYQAILSSGEPIFEMHAYNVRPTWKGKVSAELIGTNMVPILITPFSNDPASQDIDVLDDGIRIIRRLAESAPFRALGVTEYEPGEGVRKRQSLSGYIASRIRGYCHPCGTCKMGPNSDPLAVVDSAGLLRGISNVYVADASVFPTIPTANTNLTCMLIGIRMARTIARTLAK
jgi:choline dehydrogenase